MLSAVWASYLPGKKPEENLAGANTQAYFVPSLVKKKKHVLYH
jgi:hypothetical protein